MKRDGLLLATRSTGKLAELELLLQPLGVDLLTLEDIGLPETSEEDDLERFETFEENALAKARYFAALTGMRTIADDSGLQVDALGGRPGVRSKRWSGVSGPDNEVVYEANRAHLLKALSGVTERAARFVCVAVYLDEKRELVVRGECAGSITLEPRGDGGFGYDPLFLSDDLGVTLAQCSAEEKKGVSHRGRAFSELVRTLLATE